MCRCKPPDHKPKKVPAPFGWEQIDRNHDGDISKKEWKWAERHGYDRLTHRGGSVDRKTYQAQLNRYLAYLEWRNQQNWHDQQNWQGEQNWGGSNWDRPQNNHDHTDRLAGAPADEEDASWYQLKAGGRD